MMSRGACETDAADIFDGSVEESLSRNDTDAENSPHRTSVGSGREQAPTATTRTRDTRRQDEAWSASGSPHGDSSRMDRAGGRRLLSATTEAVTRLKAMTIRLGKNGKEHRPRSMAAMFGTSSPLSKRRKNNDTVSTSPREGSASSVLHAEGSARARPLSKELDGRESPEDNENASSGEKVELSDLFGDDEQSGPAELKAASIATTDDQEYAASARSNWASTLIASTLARERTAGKTSTDNYSHSLPRLEDADNDVHYLTMICKSAHAYASAQAHKLSRLRDGKHMITQLHDVGSDLGRQQDKLLAVYSAREVRRSADRLGETFREVYEVLGDVESTTVMFGRKKGYGKRISALVHDIGTHANTLLAATSLAIADRPHVLYMADAGGREPPLPQQEELVRMCIEGDKRYFGRGEEASPQKAFEAYSWAAERGSAEGMYMMASMYRDGVHVETDNDACQVWLEKATEKGHAPAMNDLAIMLLREADILEGAHPEIRADRVPAQGGASGSGAGVNGVKASRRPRSGERSGEGKQEEEQDQEQSEAEQSDGDDRGDARWSPRQEKLFEEVMEKRKRSVHLLEQAAKAGSSEAMTNLGNVQEAMGYFEDAKSWYRLAAEPSEAGNNPRAQNYLGLLYFEGRGVAKDLVEAVRWFNRSARNGHARAYQNLGICYQHGLGVAKDVPKAIGLFRRAVQGGSTRAANSLANIIARDALRSLVAVHRCAPASVLGDGRLLQEPARARTRADGGSLEAPEQAGKVWLEGTAQLRDAVVLFRRAADGGISDASFQLGRLYQQGLGLPRDPVAAFANYLAAADGETAHPAAAACVGDMLYSGIGCLQDYEEALRHYLRAAAAGDAASANAVGLMHELGRGVARDLGAASEWYTRAADMGSSDGAFNAALLVERGDPVCAILSAAGLSVAPAPQRQEDALEPPSSREASAELRTEKPPARATRAARVCSRRSGHIVDEECFETSHPQRKTVGKKAWGNRYFALRMFERAADLGHPQAADEVRRLRLRERLDAVATHGSASTVASSAHHDLGVRLSGSSASHVECSRDRP